MTAWHEVAPPPSPAAPGRTGRVLRALVPFALAAVIALLGAPVVAAAVALAGLALALLRLLWPAGASRVERVFDGFGRLVGRVLTAVLLWVVELVVFVPLSLIAVVIRRDPLAGPGGRIEAGWAPRSSLPADLTGRTFGAEVAATRRRRPVLHVTYLAVRVVGWIVIVLGLNYALGWTWDEYLGSHDSPEASGAPIGTISALAEAPASQDEPWGDAYWDEFRDLTYEFHPFLLTRVGATDGSFIRTEGAVRRSYEPAGTALEVWFLGGAALWGQGQRDLHTIPSEVARLAEADGRPIRAVNLGQPGYTSWQSALLLEQELAVRPAPDLVVFYDGADDVAVQVEQPSVVPSHYNVAGVGEALTGRDSAREQAEDWWQSYRDTSVVNRVLDRFEGLFGAQPAAADGPGLADRATDLHARSLDLASFVAERHGVDVLFAWQAAAGVPGDGGAYRRVAEGSEGGDPLDLSRVLDDAPEPVYLDGVLTNERGARLAAGSLWPAISARLE